VTTAQKVALLKKTVFIFHSECADGRWGRGCQSRCDCGGYLCDKENGKCFCPPGFMGPKCNTGSSVFPTSIFIRFQSALEEISARTARYPASANIARTVRVTQDAVSVAQDGVARAAKSALATLLADNIKTTQAHSTL
jgi:hypothetical protein